MEKLNSKKTEIIDFKIPDYATQVMCPLCNYKNNAKEGLLKCDGCHKEFNVIFIKSTTYFRKGMKYKAYCPYCKNEEDVDLRFGNKHKCSNCPNDFYTNGEIKAET